MKFSIFLLALFNSAALLMAQTGGGGGSSGGGTGGGGSATGASGQTGGGTAPASQPRALAVPAQTSPVQTSPLQTSPTQSRVSSPSLGGRIDAGSQAVPQETIEGASTSGTGLSSPAGTRPAGPIDETRPNQAPTGVGPLNPIIPPQANSFPPPIQNSIDARSFDPQVVDPAGAATTGEQASLGTSGAGGGSALNRGQGEAQSFNDAGFSQQLQQLTARPGTTQIALPQDNSVVTIVSQQNGIITLRGAVSSEEQRTSLEQSIRGATGAGFVDNQLVVIPETGASLNEARSGVAR